MKRVLMPLLCLALMVSLGACDTWWNLIVAGITGKGYYQVSYSTVASAYASSYLTTSSIDLTSLTTSSVIVFRTRSPNYYFGKLALASSFSTSSITIQYVTYSDSSGTVASSSYGTTVSSGSGFDLENNSQTGSTAASADFVFDGANLVPKNSAVFYLYSQ